MSVQKETGRRIGRELAVSCGIMAVEPCLRTEVSLDLGRNSSEMQARLDFARARGSEGHDEATTSPPGVFHLIEKIVIDGSLYRG